MMMNLCLRAVSVCALDDDGDDNSQKWWLLLLFVAKTGQIKVGKVLKKLEPEKQYTVLLKSTLLHNETTIHPFPISYSKGTRETRARMLMNEKQCKVFPSFIWRWLMIPNVVKAKVSTTTTTRKPKELVKHWHFLFHYTDWQTQHYQAANDSHHQNFNFKKQWCCLPW